MEELKDLSEKLLGDTIKEESVFDEANCEERNIIQDDVSTNARPLSLARIQSLVSMTTPRDGILYGSSSLAASPPFVEFDMSLDGFGCLFIPSVFPQVGTYTSSTNYLNYALHTCKLILSTWNTERLVYAFLFCLLFASAAFWIESKYICSTCMLRFTSYDQNIECVNWLTQNNITK